MSTKALSRAKTRFSAVGLAAATACALTLGLSAASPAPASAATPACKSLNATTVLGTKMVNAGCSKVGAPYKLGGGHSGALPAAANGALDCSGLTRFAFWKATGRDVMNTTAQKQATDNPGGGAVTTWAGLKPGDLAFFDWAAKPNVYHIQHVAIYIGTKDGKKWFVEAVKPGVNAKVSTYTSKNFIAGRHYVR